MKEKLENIFAFAKISVYVKVIDKNDQCHTRNVHGNYIYISLG